MGLEKGELAGRRGMASYRCADLITLVLVHVYQMMEKELRRA